MTRMPVRVLSALIVAVSVLIVLAFLVTDLLRSPDVSGWGKVGWLLVLLLLPVVGLIVYVVVRAPSLSRRSGRRGGDAYAIRDEGDA